MKLKNIPTYRSDIDGLRAVAVLLVIIFHLDKSLLPGGFIGVDIFFVISGYLISLYIFTKIDSNEFSLAEFYRRRVKRIAPAMFTVLIVVLVASQFMLLPLDAKDVASSALWSVFSMTNVYFFLNEDVSYFASSMNEKPLLHYWSLAVEEQFYLLWPVILLLTYKKKAMMTFLLALILLSLFSFLAAQYFYSTSPSFVYYMLPTRSGELMVGAIVALIIKSGYGLKYQYITHLSLSYTGMILIVLSVIVISEDAVFPGIIALLPTVGAALLIFSGQYSENPIAQVLKSSFLVKIGLISYSAYLWHWPLIAFFRYGLFEQTWLSNITLILLTFFLALISYLYIEQPFRYSNQSVGKVFKKLLVYPAICITSIALGALILEGHGIRILSDKYLKLNDSVHIEVKPNYHFKYVCQKSLISISDIKNEACIVGYKSTENKEEIDANIILIGDSNAAHYVGMLGAFAKE